MKNTIAVWHEYPGSTPEPKPETSDEGSWIIGFLLMVLVIIISTQSSAAYTNRKIAESRNSRR